jgi:protein TonB
VALHAAAVAAILLGHPPAMTDRGAEGLGVALVFADTVALAGGSTPLPAVAEPEAAPETDTTPAPPQPDRGAAPEPATAPPAAEAAPPPAAVPAPLQPARAAARSPSPPARPAPAPMRLDAGAGAFPDPSLGARALGAVVPPGLDDGHRNAPPDYPPESRRRGEEGVVRLLIRVNAEGEVAAVEIVASSGHPALDAAAVAAARRWRFRPAMQAGRPVSGTLSTAVHFRLTDR